MDKEKQTTITTTRKEDTPAEEKATGEQTAPKKPKTEQKNIKKRAGIAVFVIGVIAMVAGIAVMLVNLLAKPAVRDADFLVSVGEWTLEDGSNSAELSTDASESAEANCIGGSGVIWDFTEIGKGKLTTNNHKNDYDFIWAIDGNKIKIETDWLYTLEDEYTYKLDQSEKILILSTGEGENLVNINFHPAGGVDTEITEDN